MERDHAVEARRRPRAQEAERVADRGVETLLAAAAHHLRALVDAGRGQSLLAEQSERLAAAATEVDDVALAGEQRQVDGEAVADLGRRAAVPALELEVVAIGHRGRQRRAPTGAGAPRARPRRRAAR